jgi:poly(A) polymerase
MPHVTLLYPFVPYEHFDTTLPTLTHVCQGLVPFQVTLATFHAFTHARGQATVWLAPEPRETFVTLQAALQAAFPAYNEQSRFAAGFTPHLSVGQTTGTIARQQLIETLQAAWQPVQFTLQALYLIWREADGPFRIYHAFPLQGARPPRLSL